MQQTWIQVVHHLSKYLRFFIYPDVLQMVEVCGFCRAKEDTLQHDEICKVM